MFLYITRVYIIQTLVDFLIKKVSCVAGEIGFYIETKRY